jgi:TPR repeat protein
MPVNAGRAKSSKFVLAPWPEDRMRPLIRFTIALLALLATIGLSTAGPLEDALAAVKAKDYARAATLLQPLAEQGNVDAEYNLGMLFVFGQGVGQSYARAIDLLSRAAAQNDPRSQLELAMLYELGFGTAKDPDKALELIRKAAEQRYAPAEYEYAIEFISGPGVPLDWQQSFFWHRRACEDGYLRGCFVVAEAYAMGLGTTRDFVEAARLYFKSLTSVGEIGAIAGIGGLAAGGHLPGVDPGTSREIGYTALTLANDLKSHLVPPAQDEPERLRRELMPKLTPDEIISASARYA